MQRSLASVLTILSGCSAAGVTSPPEDGAAVITPATDAASRPDLTMPQGGGDPDLAALDTRFLVHEWGTYTFPPPHRPSCRSLLPNLS